MMVSTSPRSLNINVWATGGSHAPTLRYLIGASMLRDPSINMISRGPPGRNAYCSASSSEVQATESQTKAVKDDQQAPLLPPCTVMCDVSAVPSNLDPALLGRCSNE